MVSSIAAILSTRALAFPASFLPLQSWPAVLSSLLTAIFVSAVALLIIRGQRKELRRAATRAESVLTERERAEAELTLFRTLIDQFDDSVEVMDPDTLRILDINQKACADHGYTREELLSRTIFDIDPTLVGEAHDKIVRQLRESGSVIWEGLHRRKDGSTFPVEVKIKLIHLEAGTYRLAIARDITERKRAEEAIALFRTLLDEVDDSVEVIDPGTLRLLDINQKSCANHGYTREELLSRTIFDIDPTVDWDVHLKIIKQLRETGSVVREGIHIRKDGSSFPVETKIKLGRLKTGDYIIAVARDITERKRAEDELRRLSGELLRLQDEERRRIARGLHDSTGQTLVALAAHIAQLRASIPSARRESRKLATLCQALADRCVREIRTLSYLLYPPMLDEAGLEDAIRHYANGLSERTGIQVDLEISPRFKRMSPDIEVALFRVVQESLTNVQRHSGSSQAKIRIVRGPATITLAVSDQGAGIRAEKRQPNGELSPALGVGIPSMQERVKLIGGHFEIESSCSGTTVHVTIPLGGQRNEETSYPAGRRPRARPARHTGTSSPAA